MTFYLTDSMIKDKSFYTKAIEQMNGENPFIYKTIRQCGSVRTRCKIFKALYSDSFSSSSSRSKIGGEQALFSQM